MNLSNDRISVSVPGGWDARLSQRDHDAAQGPARAAARASRSTRAWRTARPRLSHLHAASFALPPGIGDYGSGAVESMSPGDAFVALFEYEPHNAGRPLFAASGLPRRLLPGWFGPDSLQRLQPGQVGVQRFFHVGGRPFGLYVVLGHRLVGRRRLPEVNRLLSSIDLA